MAAFFQELRRRHVYRTFAMYVVAAWVIVQVAELAFEAWDIPSRNLRYLWMVFGAGSPVALIFAWVYDVTADGIVRVRPRQADEDVDLSLKRFDYVLITAFVFVMAMVAVGVLYSSDMDRETWSEYANPAIAVLPLEDLSQEGDLEKFGRATAESLVTQLGHIKELDVIATSSSFQFKRAAMLPEIRDALQAEYLVEGNVNRDGQTIVVNARLIDAANGRQLWAHDFRGEQGTLFNVQEQIAEQIADHLGMTLGDPRRYGWTSSFEAQEAFERAQESDDDAVVQQFYDEALAFDPNFAYIYVERAWDIFYSIRMGKRTPIQAWNEANPLLDRALSIADQMPDAYTVRGELHTWLDEYDAAVSDFMSALEINPSDPYALMNLAKVYAVMGRTKEAVTLARRDVRINPLDGGAHLRLANRLNSDGQAEEALREYERAVELAPGSFAVWHDYIFGITDPWKGSIRGFKLLARMESVFAQLATEEDRRQRSIMDLQIAGAAEALYAFIGDAAGREAMLRFIATQVPRENYADSWSGLYRQRGEYADAQREALVAIEGSPKDLGILADAISISLETGAAPKEWLDRVRDVSPGLFSETPRVREKNLWKLPAMTALLLREQGDDGQATRILNAVVDEYDLDDLERARALAFLGRVDEALDALEARVDSGRWFDVTTAVEWAPLAGKPRFQALVSRIRDQQAKQREEVAQMIARGELELPSAPAAGEPETPVAGDGSK